MRGLFIHSVVFAVVNALLVGAWLVTAGSTTELSNVQADPLFAVRHGFWPLVIGAVWGGALVIHAGAWMGSLLSGGKKARSRRAARMEVYKKLHQRKREHQRDRRERHGRPREAVAPEPNADLAKDAARAAIGLVESLAGRAVSRPSKPAVSTPGRQWVAVMFTDLVGSTGLAESLGDTTWHEMLAGHRQLVRKCVDDHDGTEVSTQGDGFLVRFETPDAAIACAISLQRSMADTRARGSFVPELRVGIHAGEAVADDNDLVGRVINLASRVTDAAEPGEILITEPVADHLSPGAALVDRGLKPLKGFAQPRHLLSVVWHPTDETIVLTTELEESGGP
jgi:class 3 adenylate cyclase